MYRTVESDMTCDTSLLVHGGKRGKDRIYKEGVGIPIASRSEPVASPLTLPCSRSFLLPIPSS